MGNPKSYRLYIIASIIMILTITLLIFMGISSWINLKMNRENYISLYQDKAKLLITSLVHSMEEKQNLSKTFNIMEYLIQNKSIRYGAVISKDKFLYIKGVSEKELNGNISRLGKKSGKTISKIINTNTMITYLTYNICFKDIKKCQNIKVIIGFDMNKFQSAKKADIRHTSVMFAIVLLLGLGVSFFMYVISVYHKLIIKLKFAGKYTENVVKNMANGLITIDSKGFIVSYNSEGLNVLGLNENIICKDINLNEFIDFEETGIGKTLKFGEKINDIECIYEQPGGINLNLSISITPLYSTTKNYGAIIIIRDLTEFKKLEKRLLMMEKLAMVGKLASVIAHEIRNPLSSIRGFAILFSKYFKDEDKLKKYSEVIVKEVDRINDVVTDLLTYSKPVDLKIQAVDVNDLFDDILNIVDLEITKKNFIAKKIIQDNIQKIYVDMARMKQVLLNLVLNSLQAADTDKIIKIGIKKSAEKGFADIWVEDSGSGIPESLHENIFNLFYTTKEKGSGLGLPIVKKIVEYHDGCINIESPVKNNKGTKIILKIPYKS